MVLGTELLLVVIGMIFFALMATSPLWWAALLRLMADHNFLITAVEEGTAKAIMHFGGFSRFAMSWRGHYFNKDWDVVEGDPKDDPENAVPEHPIDKWLPGSLHWLGIFFANTILRYHFQWTSIRQGAPGTGVETPMGLMSIVKQGELYDLLVSRDQKPNRIYLKADVYGITFKSIDDHEKIPLQFIALFTAQIVNPYKALFDTEQWLEQITNFLRNYVKTYVSAKTFEQLVTTDPEKASTATQGQSEEILGYTAPGGLPIGQYILKKWGVQIDHFNLVNFETSGKRGEAYEEAAATKYLKAQEAEGIRELAKAERDREKIVAEGEAERIRIVTDAIKAAGEAGMTLRQLEALETVGKEGNMVVLNGKAANVLLNPLKKEKKKEEEEKKK